MLEDGWGQSSSGFNSFAVIEEVPKDNKRSEKVTQCGGYCLATDHPSIGSYPGCLLVLVLQVSLLQGEEERCWDWNLECQKCSTTWCGESYGTSAKRLAWYRLVPTTIDRYALSHRNAFTSLNTSQLHWGRNWLEGARVRSGTWGSRPRTRAKLVTFHAWNA